MPIKLNPIGVSLLLLAQFQVASTLEAIQVTGYLSVENDRFTSGFPLAPNQNADSSFVGNGLDWSGMGWSTQTYESSSYKGLAILSPRHFLSAQHYEYDPNDGSGSLNQKTSGIRARGIDGSTYTATTETQTHNLGYGLELQASNGAINHDLMVGTLTEPITRPSNITRLAALDLNTTSSTDSLSNYTSLSVFLYGRSSSTNGSPRIGATTPTRLAYNATLLQPFLATDRNEIQLQLGDSAAPALHDWTNPNGEKELTVLGVNSATSGTENFISFLPVSGGLSAAQTAMNPSGYALRIVGNASNSWDGNPSTNITNNLAWNSSVPRTDQYVTFDPAVASNRNVSVTSSQSLRGLYFTSSASTGDSFSFSGNATLSIGRGGITNYDADSQNFTAPIALSAPQYWDAGPGGLNIDSLNTNGHLLELSTQGASTLSGSISGSGGLALSGGSLSLSHTSSYTGPTWVHEGDLQVTGDISASSLLTLAEFGTLSGSGQASDITGSGTVSPGNSSGILTAPSLTLSEGLDFAFEFTAASAPLFSNASASINDLLRLTAVSPFPSSSSGINTIAIYLDAGALQTGQTFQGGFFTDQAADFLSAINAAQFEFYIADNSGSISFGGKSYSAYEGPYRFTPSTELQDADFGSGTLSGRILQLLVEPDLSQYEGWIIFHNLSGSDALSTADTDHDGIPQLHEFAFGGDPNTEDRAILPSHTITTDSGNQYLEISYTRPSSSNGLTYTAQTTSNLNSWPTDSTGVSQQGAPVDHGDGTQTWTYRRTTPVNGAETAFIRVSISEAP